jgi:hypothetical protein
LAANESFHVVFRKAAQASSRQVEAPKMMGVAALTGKWDVEFEANRGAPARTVMDSLAPLNENADPGIRYFSGIATYRKSFSAPKGWKPGRPLALDLGEAREVAEVRVNGNIAGYAWHAPYRLEIGKFVRSGADNKLEVRVANLWVNRLIRDADPAVTDKVSWTASATYKPDAPLRRSGLIGPVTISGAGQ